MMEAFKYTNANGEECNLADATKAALFIGDACVEEIVINRDNIALGNNKTRSI